MFSKDTIDKFGNIPTPFYFYDIDILNATCETVKRESERFGYKVHYAIKANANPGILKIISSFGIGADCVSWNEIERALESGFKPSGIVFAGVGKTDMEIESALKAGIFCFNCESIPEIEAINEIAARLHKTADIALRINPLVDAHTHKHITTGVEESKFGINTWELEDVLKRISIMKTIRLLGIHFHVGSQIQQLSVFNELCEKINELQDWFAERKITLSVINIGGGLGIDYADPERNPDFEEYFSVISKSIKLRKDQQLHLEPGRSIIGQCGSLISRVIYIKNGNNTNFAIIDAGMNDLIRPALYQAVHKIENLTSEGSINNYDVVGPVCESSDTFGKNISLPETRRGDIIAIRSAGAYGEAMASRYNLRDLPESVFSTEI